MTIYAVVVTYYPHATALSSLIEELSRQVDWIMVVDNTDAHDDGVLEILHGCTGFPNGLSLVRLGRNLGIAAALNIGIDAALREGCTHVLLSDQDSLPSDGMVAGLMDTERELMASGKRVGAVGPVYKDKVTGVISPFQIHKPGHLFYSRVHVGRDRPSTEVVSLITSGTLISSSALRDVGLMSEKLFIDHVDVEWCHRATSRGFSLIGTAAGSMVHDMGDNRIKVWWLRWRYVSGYSPTRLYYRFRNFVYLWRLPYISVAWKLRALWFWCGEAYAHLLFSSERQKNMRGIACGIMDGIRGRMGPAKMR